MNRIFKSIKAVLEKLNFHEKSQVLDDIIFSSRWMLYFVNFGLIVALILYIKKFLHEVFELLMSTEPSSVESLKIEILGFVDAGLVASLVIMVIQGGHQIFIRKFKSKPKAETPGYLDNIDTGILKTKVALSISLIMGVQILKDYVNMDHIKHEVVMDRLLILSVFAVVTTLIAAIWRITHPPHHGGHENGRKDRPGAKGHGQHGQAGDAHGTGEPSAHAGGDEAEHEKKVG